MLINLGSINGGTEILKDFNTGKITLISNSNRKEFDRNEAETLSYAVLYAMNSTTPEDFKTIQEHSPTLILFKYNGAVIK